MLSPAFVNTANRALLQIFFALHVFDFVKPDNRLIKKASTLENMIKISKLFYFFKKVDNFLNILNYVIFKCPKA